MPPPIKAVLVDLSGYAFRPAPPPPPPKRRLQHPPRRARPHPRRHRRALPPPHAMRCAVRQQHVQGELGVPADAAARDGVRAGEGGAVHEPRGDAEGGGEEGGAAHAVAGTGGAGGLRGDRDGRAQRRRGGTGPEIVPLRAAIRGHAGVAGLGGTDHRDTQGEVPGEEGRAGDGAGAVCSRARVRDGPRGHGRRQALPRVLRLGPGGPRRGARGVRDDRRRRAGRRRRRDGGGNEGDPGAHGQVPRWGRGRARGEPDGGGGGLCRGGGSDTRGQGVTECRVGQLPQASCRFRVSTGMRGILR